MGIEEQLVVGSGDKWTSLILFETEVYKKARY